MNILIMADIQRIFHLSDIHINYTYKDVIANVFEKTLEIISSECNEQSMIVITGDLFDRGSKTMPAEIIIARNILIKLNELCPIYIIPGNHDTTPNTLEDNDPIFLTVSTILINKEKPIKYCRRTGNYKFRNILFSVLSRAETLNPDNLLMGLPSIKEHEYYIALLHETYGKTRFISVPGNAPDSFSINSDFCDQFDYVLMGDIHAHRVFGSRNHVAYAGSLYQQNISESDEKGFMIWDLNTRVHRLALVPSKYGFVQIKMAYDTFNSFPPKLPEIIRKAEVICTNCLCVEEKYLLSRINSNLYPHQPDIKKIKVRVKRDEKITFSSPTNFSTEEDIDFMADNNVIRDCLDASNIVEFLEKKLITEEEIEKVVTYHNRLISKVNYDTSPRNRWKLLLMEWNNISCYGESNRIDFSKISNNSIIGVISDNATGKSSIIDILLLVFCDESKTKNKDDLVNKGCINGTIKISVKNATDIYDIDMKVFIGRSEIHILKNGIDIFPDNKHTYTEAKPYISQTFGELKDIITSCIITQNIKHAKEDFIVQDSNERIKAFNDYFQIERLTNLGAICTGEYNSDYFKLCDFYNIKHSPKMRNEIPSLVDIEFSKKEKKYNNDKEIYIRSQQNIEIGHKLNNSIAEEMSKIQHILLHDIKKPYIDEILEKKYKGRNFSPAELILPNIISNKSSVEIKYILDSIKTLIGDSCDLEDVQSKKKNIETILANLDPIELLKSKEQEIIKNIDITYNEILCLYQVNNSDSISLEINELNNQLTEVKYSNTYNADIIALSSITSPVKHSIQSYPITSAIIKERESIMEMRDKWDDSIYNDEITKIELQIKNCNDDLMKNISIREDIISEEDLIKYNITVGEEPMFYNIDKYHLTVDIINEIKTIKKPIIDHKFNLECNLSCSSCLKNKSFENNINKELINYQNVIALLQEKANKIYTKYLKEYKIQKADYDSALSRILMFKKTDKLAAIKLCEDNLVIFHNMLKNAKDNLLQAKKENMEIYLAQLLDKALSMDREYKKYLVEYETQKIEYENAVSKISEIRKAEEDIIAQRIELLKNKYSSIEIEKEQKILSLKSIKENYNAQLELIKSKIENYKSAENMREIYKSLCEKEKYIYDYNIILSDYKNAISYEDVIEKIKYQEQLNNMQNYENTITDLKSRYNKNKESYESNITQLKKFTQENDLLKNTIDRDAGIINYTCEMLKILRIKKLYKDCTDLKSGIPAQFLMYYIDIITNYMNFVLQQNDVDFTVERDIDFNLDGALTLFNFNIIQDNKKIPIQSASGFQTAILSFAARISLIRLIPRSIPNFLFIDEAFTSFDITNTAAICLFLKKISTQFNFIFIISHLPNLQEIIDIRIPITRHYNKSYIIYQ